MTELQQKLLDLLKSIDALCRKYGVEYYLTGGSLIGAVRHRGFIPWDDDADIIMTRENWEKFYDVVRDELPEHMALMTQYEDIDQALTTNYYVDTTTSEIYRFHLTNPGEAGIAVDVLIMDPVPDDNQAKENYIRALETHTELTNLYYQPSLRYGKSIGFWHLWKRVQSEGKRSVIEDIDRTAFHYKEEKSRYYVQRFASAPHFWKKEYYGTPRYVPFEDTFLPIPEHPGDCLSLGYDDDWMYIPKKGPDKSEHQHVVRSLSVPSSVILNEFERQIDRPSMEKVFLKRKQLWDENVERHHQSELALDQPETWRVRYIYSKKLEETNLGRLIKDRDYPALEELFQEYLDAQVRGGYLGSSSLMYWQAWYYKCHPCLIDIGDQALYAVCLLLLHKKRLAIVGKLIKARHLLDRPLTEELLGIESMYLDIKALRRSAESRDWVNVEEVLRKREDELSANPFLFEYHLMLEFAQNVDRKKLLEECESGLKLFPESEGILMIRAKAQIGTGDIQGAFETLNELQSVTRNGLILMEMKDCIEATARLSEDDRGGSLPWQRLLKRIDFVLQGEFSGEYQSENAKSELSDVQEKRLVLLAEIDEICRKEGIEYFLGEEALRMAVLTGKYSDPKSDLVVLMTPENAESFMNVIEREDRDDRYIDCLTVNPCFRGTAIHYCDTKSLDAEVTQPGHWNGLYVSIELLRKPSSSRIANMIDSVMERGWEATQEAKYGGKRSYTCKEAVKILCAVCGKRRIRQWIYRKVMKGYKRADHKIVFKRKYWLSGVSFSAGLFRKPSDIAFEGHTFKTVTDYEEYLTIEYGENWRECITAPSNGMSNRRITDAHITGDELCTYMKANGVDIQDIQRRWKEDNEAYIPIKILSDKINQYWKLMCRIGAGFTEPDRQS